MIKLCPFALSVANQALRACMGEECINFEWRYFQDQNYNLGSCKFFDRWTGHELRVLKSETQ